jgi:hypothetical protein
MTAAANRAGAVAARRFTANPDSCEPASKLLVIEAPTLSAGGDAGAIGSGQQPVSPFGGRVSSSCYRAARRAFVGKKPGNLLGQQGEGRLFFPARGPESQKKVVLASGGGVRSGSRGATRGGGLG